MKIKTRIFICIAVFFISYNLYAQVTSSGVTITKTYSSNHRFYIKCIPYDNEEPSLRGESFVYNNQDKLLYTINRGFNGLKEFGNFLGISNDGNTIIYIITRFANEDTDGLRSVSIYKNASLVKSFTLSQITGCNIQNERCNLMFYDYNVIDRGKSNWGTLGYKKVFKDTVSDQGKFLSDHPVFSFKDSIYITDSKKNVHIIDLKTGSIAAGISFNNVYPRLKDFQIENLTDIQRFKAPYPPDKSYFPNLANGDITGVELAKYLGMKAARVMEPDFRKYKVYQVHIQAYVSKEGKINIINVDAHKPLPIDKIIAFFNSHTYDMAFLPAEFDKWYFKSFYWGFRNVSDEIALNEKEADIKQQQLERGKRLTLDSINHIYIPQNMEECFIQLDKQLPQVSKNEMRILKSRSEMISYHLTLGMWMRNSWGLHGGSRLLVYFQNRGLYDAEGISGTVLEDYYDWLNGKKDIGKEFEVHYPDKK